ncbi:hypothetical protein MMC14_007311 [Varicellaria rhodocarpa]|nr:hypothetical protein [Varicellaria rhodocarpa]
MGNLAKPSPPVPSYEDSTAHHHEQHNQYPIQGSSSMVSNSVHSPIPLSSSLNPAPPLNTDTNNIQYHTSPPGYASAPASEADVDTESATLLQNIVPSGTNHAHCEECQRLLDQKEKRAADRHCCNMVAAVFVILFLSVMVIGIVAITHVRR